MNDRAKTLPAIGREFAVLCFGGYLLAISYGVTFLVPLLVIQRGGNEAGAGLIISAATVSTIFSVILSGHIADRMGTARSIAVFSLFLVASSLGFAFIPSVGAGLVMMGFLLGIGWGTYYTLGPILVAAIAPPEHRGKYFALLSGSMMTGIGSGPIIGRLIHLMGFPVEATFVFAAITAALGGGVYLWLHHRLRVPGTMMPQVSKISLVAAWDVICSRALYSIIMVGVGGAVFGSLSSFQTIYADHYGFDYSLFFAGFMTAAILCRMFFAGYIVRCNPFRALLVLTGLTLSSTILFRLMPHNEFIYILSAAILGVGYGLTYSVINGLAASEAPEGRMPQSLLLFSLSYFLGIFGFPLIAGQLIVTWGMGAMLLMIIGLAVISFAIVLFRFFQHSYR